MIKTVTEVLYRINVDKEIEDDLLKEAVKEVFEIVTPQREICLGEIFTGLLLNKANPQVVEVILRAVFELDHYNRKAQPKHTANKKVIEYIGSGKKGVKTINISTPSAIVAASAGVCVLKKGSVSTSSVSGSADFMAVLGFKQDNTVEMVNDSLDKINFCFTNIEDIIPRFDSAYNGKFHVPHILSLGLPAIVTPVRGDIVMYGLAHPNILTSANVLHKFGVEKGVVITNTSDEIHYIDEICPFGKTSIVNIEDGSKIVNYNMGKMFSECENVINDILQRPTPKENVKCVLNILQGRGTETQNNTLCVNAANLLCLSQIACDFQEGIDMAKEKIYNMGALEKLEEYLEYTKSDMDKYWHLKKESIYV